MHSQIIACASNTKRISGLLVGFSEMMVQLNCHLAPHWLQTTLALFWLQLILHCRLLSWYSSIAAGLPSGHKTTCQKNQQPYAIRIPPQSELAQLAQLTNKLSLSTELALLATLTLLLNGTAQLQLGSQPTSKPVTRINNYTRSLHATLQTVSTPNLI